MEHPEVSIDDSFFIGLCWYCKSPGSASRPLRRCGGCQLVAYCSRDCQKENRPCHKYVCKEFPVVKGKNVFHTAPGNWKKHIGVIPELRDIKMVDNFDFFCQIFWISCFFLIIQTLKCQNIKYPIKLQKSLITAGQRSQNIGLICPKRHVRN